MRWVMPLVVLCSCGRINFELPALDVPGDGSFDTMRVGDGAADARPVDLIPGLIVYYPLDDVAFNGFAFDATGSNRPATCEVGVSCPVPTAGRVGGAAMFDGTTRFRTPFDVRFNTTTAFTISAWMRPTSVAQNHTVMCKPVGAGDNNSWGLEIAGTPTVRLKVATSESAFNALVASITVNTWVHLTGTWDGTMTELYRDGTRVVFGSLSTTAWDTGDLFIGSDFNSGSPAGAFEGLIDEVRLYDRALTANEIVLLATP